MGPSSTRPGSGPVASFRLPDAVIVTGTSSGLGEVCAGQLLEAGARVVGVDMAPVATDFGNRYAHVQGSVAEEATWQRAAEALIAGDPTTIGLAACAAILHVGDVLELPLERWQQTWNVNVMGTVLGMRAVLPLMFERGGGPVVAVASVDAHFAEQQLVSYCASKAALLQLARTAALDHARRGVRINVVSPGPMRAGLFERHLASADDPDRFLATRTNRQPMGQILDPADVARAVVFALSDGSRGMTGTQITVDGGLTTGFDFRTGDEGAAVA